MKLIIPTLLLLSGCRTIYHQNTPLYWSQEDHTNMMLMCKSACGEDRMFNYETITAKCTCREAK